MLLNPLFFDTEQVVGGKQNILPAGKKVSSYLFSDIIRVSSEQTALNTSGRVNSSDAMLSIGNELTAQKKTFLSQITDNSVLGSLRKGSLENEQLATLEKSVSLRYNSPARSSIRNLYSYDQTKSILKNLSIFSAGELKGDQDTSRLIGKASSGLSADPETEKLLAMASENGGALLEAEINGEKILIHLTSPGNGAAQKTGSESGQDMKGIELTGNGEKGQGEKFFIRAYKKSGIEINLPALTGVNPAGGEAESYPVSDAVAVSQVVTQTSSAESEGSDNTEIKVISKENVTSATKVTNRSAGSSELQKVEKDIPLKGNPAQKEITASSAGSVTEITAAEGKSDTGGVLTGSAGETPVAAGINAAEETGEDGAELKNKTGQHYTNVNKQAERTTENGAVQKTIVKSAAPVEEQIVKEKGTGPFKRKFFNAQSATMDFLKERGTKTKPSIGAAGKVEIPDQAREIISKEQTFPGQKIAASAETGSNKVKIKNTAPKVTVKTSAGANTTQKSESKLTGENTVKKENQIKTGASAASRVPEKGGQPSSTASDEVRNLLNKLNGEIISKDVNADAKKSDNIKVDNSFAGETGKKATAEVYREELKNLTESTKSEKTGIKEATEKGISAEVPVKDKSDAVEQPEEKVNLSQKGTVSDKEAAGENSATKSAAQVKDTKTIDTQPVIKNSEKIIPLNKEEKTTKTNVEKKESISEPVSGKSSEIKTSVTENKAEVFVKDSGMPEKESVVKDNKISGAEKKENKAVADSAVKNRDKKLSASDQAIKTDNAKTTGKSEFTTKETKSVVGETAQEEFQKTTKTVEKDQAAVKPEKNEFPRSGDLKEPPVTKESMTVKKQPVTSEKPFHSEADVKTGKAAGGIGKENGKSVITAPEKNTTEGKSKERGPTGPELVNRKEIKSAVPENKGMEPVNKKTAAESDKTRLNLNSASDNENKTDKSGASEKASQVPVKETIYRGGSLKVKVPRPVISGTTANKDTTQPMDAGKPENSMRDAASRKDLSEKTITPVKEDKGAASDIKADKPELKGKESVSVSPDKVVKESGRKTEVNNVPKKEAPVDFQQDKKVSGRKTTFEKEIIKEAKIENPDKKSSEIKVEREIPGKNREIIINEKRETKEIRTDLKPGINTTRTAGGNKEAQSKNISGERPVPSHKTAESGSSLNEMAGKEQPAKVAKDITGKPEKLAASETVKTEQQADPGASVKEKAAAANPAATEKSVKPQSAKEIISGSPERTERVKGEVNKAEFSVPEKGENKSEPVKNITTANVNNENAEKERFTEVNDSRVKETKITEDRPDKAQFIKTAPEKEGDSAAPELKTAAKNDFEKPPVNIKEDQLTDTVKREDNLSRGNPDSEPEKEAREIRNDKINLNDRENYSAAGESEDFVSEIEEVISEKPAAENSKTYAADPEPVVAKPEHPVSDDEIINELYSGITLSENTGAGELAALAGKSAEIIRENNAHLEFTRIKPDENQRAEKEVEISDTKNDEKPDVSFKDVIPDNKGEDKYSGEREYSSAQKLSSKDEKQDVLRESVREKVIIKDPEKILSELSRLIKETEGKSEIKIVRNTEEPARINQVPDKPLNDSGSENIQKDESLYYKHTTDETAQNKEFEKNIFQETTRNSGKTENDNIGKVANNVEFRQTQQTPKVEAPLKNEAPPRTVPQEKIYDEIESLVKSREDKSIVLKLSPERLGDMKVMIRVAREGVHANIEVENDAVRQMLMNSTSDLRTSLAQSGLQLNSFNISTSQGDKKFTKGDSEKRRDFSGTKNEETEEISEKNRERNLGYNTMEYTV